MAGTKATTGPKKSGKKISKKDKNMLHLKSYLQKLGKHTFSNPELFGEGFGPITLTDETLQELNQIANFLINKIATQSTNVQKYYTGGSTLNAQHIRAACGLVLPDLIEKSGHVAAQDANNKYEKAQ